MRKNFIYIIAITITIIILLCNIIYAKYILNKDFKISISTLPFYFNVETSETTFKMYDNQSTIDINIKNNDGTNYDKFDTAYTISLEGNEKFSFSVNEETLTDNTIVDTIDGGKKAEKNFSITITLLENYYLGVQENINLVIKTTTPYAKTIEIPIVIQNPTYLKDGLLVWYDGIENTRTGHSDTATAWENLITEDIDGTLKNVDFTEASGWTENSLILDGDDDWVQMEYLYYKNMTIEIVAKPLDIPTDQELCTYLADYQNGGMGISTEEGLNLGKAYISSYRTVPSTNTMKLKQIYSMSAGYDGKTLYFSENGDYYTGSYSGTLGKPESSTVFAIGTNTKGTAESIPSGENKCSMEVYSVRIYSRCLTQEEILHNYVIDQERFNIEEIALQENPPYIQDGLVALYDGEKNTRYGHSQKSSQWNNLISTNYDGTLTNFDFTDASGWTENSLILDGSNDWVKLGYIYNKNMTIEIVATPLALVSNKKQYYINNYQNGGLGLGKNEDGYNYGQVWVSSYKKLPSSNTTSINKIYSMSSGHNGTTQYFRENQDIYTSEISGTMGKPDSSTIFALGTNPNGTSQELLSSEARFNMKVYSVRIYNRCLTEDEMKYNYQIDKERFGIE